MLHGLLPQIVNFTILVLLIAYLVKNPLKKFLEGRRGGIAKEVEEARKMKLLAENQWIEFSKRIENFENEAQRLFKQAEKEAANVKNKILLDAEEKARQILVDAELNASAQIDSLKSALLHSTVDAAIKLLEAQLRSTLTADDLKKIMHEQLRKVS